MLDDVRYHSSGFGCKEAAKEVTTPQALYENVSCGRFASSHQRPADNVPREPLYTNVHVSKL